FVSFIQIVDGEHRAPQTRRAFVRYAEYRHPLFRVCDVGIHRVAALAQVVIGAEDGKALGPCKPFELGTDRLAGEAAAAVAPTQPGSLELLRLTFMNRECGGAVF